jgi:hypothetical protein
VTNCAVAVTCLCSGVGWWCRLLAGIQLTEDAQLPADVPSLIQAQVAAAEERAGSPHADVINSFFELQAGRGSVPATRAGPYLLDDSIIQICDCAG